MISNIKDVKYFFYGDEVVAFQRYNIDSNCGEKYVWSFANNDIHEVIRGTHCPNYSDTEEFRKQLYDTFDDCIKAHKKEIRKICKKKIIYFQNQIDFYNKILEITNK